MNNIEIVEIENENGFVTVLDDDGMVTIQMSEESVNEIINVFDKHIMNKNEHKELIQVTEFGKTFILHFNLENTTGGYNNEDGFHLSASIGGGNLYHDFELDYCDIKTWELIKNLVK